MLLGTVSIGRAQAPMLTAWSPTHNTPSAPRTTNVAATFNQSLSTSPATQQALKVFSQQAGGKKAGTATVSGNTLTFDPSSDFKAGETVFATVTSAVQSSGGITLAKPQVFQFTTATSPSTGTFANGPDVVAGTNGGDLATGDLDGDGDLDLLKISLNSPENTISVFVRLNNGTGTFGGNQEIVVNDLGSNLLLGDLDSDSDLDFVFGTTTYLNNGLGTFSQSSSFQAYVATAPSLYDMDADGDLDLLFTFGNGIFVRLNDGNGTFSTSTTFDSTVRSITGYTAGDIDNDGDIDVLFGIERGNGATGIALNNGNATFNLGTTGITSLLLLPYLARLIDVDADGDLDLVNAGYGEVEVLLNNGAGTFSRSSVFDAGGTYIPGLTSGDLDGDGDIDLLISSSTAQGMYVRLNDGNGTFSGIRTLPFSASKLADIDGDGDLDLLGSSATGAKIYLNQNITTPAVTALSPTRNARSAPRNTNVAVTFNQPLTNNAATLGALKLFSQQAGGLKASSVTVSGHTLTANPTADFKPGETVFATLTTAVQSSNGTLPKAEVFQFTTATPPAPGTFTGGTDLAINGNPMGVALGDVDGDGDLDLLTANGEFGNPDGNNVSVRLNNGTGTYSAGSTVPVGNGPGAIAPPETESIVLGDLDGDGDLDFATGNGRANTVSIRFNNGSGAFSGIQEVQTPTNAFTLAFGDVDGDGDLDMVVSQTSGTTNKLNVFLNNGSGIFSSGSEVTVGSQPGDVALGDVDNDGDLDVLATTSLDGTVSVRLNNGSGVFSGTQNVPSGLLVGSLALGDIDGDGDLDFVAANTNGITASVRRNNGLGNFSGTEEVSLTDGLYRVKLSDVDGDGDLDLLTASISNGFVAVRLNNGSGVFSGNQNVAVGLNPRDLALGDVDGDGDLDLAVANGFSQSVSIRLNQILAGPSITSIAPSISPVGSTVVINGTNFLNTTGITFNGVTAPSFVVNGLGTQITVTVPAGATSGPVVVATATGVSNGFQFTVGPLLTVTNLVPNRNAVTAPRNTSVAVTLSQPLNNGAATLGALTVFSQQAQGKKPGTATVSGNTLTFDPSADFKAGETVFATTTTAVQNSGTTQNLLVPQVFQFTTATAPSPGTFNGGSDPSVGNGPVNVASGDVDGDGDLDLITTNLGNPSGPAGLGNGTTATVRLNNGNGTFTNAQQLTVGRGPAQAVLADVDNDGDLDLLTANSSSADVSVRFNNGSGNFDTGFLVGSGNIHGIAVGDVDGDGDQDLLIADYNEPSTVTVGLNNGTGMFPLFNFANARRVSVGSRPLNIALGDVDNDGDLDFVTSSSNGATASVRFNNGLGSFSGSQEVAVGFNPMSVVLGDVDKDGDLDLVTANYYDYTNPANNYTNSTASVRLNNGNGFFNGTQNVAIGRGARQAVLGDVDGDGDLDLLATNELTNTASVRLNNGSGIFSGNQQVAVGNSPNNLALADLDGDGDLDLATANFLGNTLSVRLNQAAAIPLLVTAAAPARNAVAAPRATPVAVTFNQNLIPNEPTLGALKVFSAQAGGQKTGTATVSSNTLSFAPTASFKPGETVFATLTTAVQSSGGASLMTGQVFRFTTATSAAPGTFGSGTDVPVGSYVSGVTTGDVDGDGDLDLLATVSGNAVSVRLNNGNGTYTSGQQVSVGFGPTAVVLGDVDSDGDLDLLTVNANYGSVSVRFNNGRGVFSGSDEIVVNSTNPLGLVLGDVDADGDLDLLTANADRSTVSVRLNNGVGTFSGTQEVTVGAGPGNLTVGDVDNDGDLDLLTANLSNNLSTVSVRLNTGNGTFSNTGQTLPVDAALGSIVLGDVDKDGDLDFVTADFENSRVSLGLNNGSGTFSSGQPIAVSAKPLDVVLGDVDGDGDLDLLAATPNTSVSVRLNNGNGSFSGSQEVGVGNYPQRLTVGDVDGDGDLDLLAANYYGNSVSVRLNQAQFVVTGVLPARNAVVAPRTTPVTFTFNLPLSSDPVTEQSIRVFGTQSGRKFGSNSVSGNILRLAPAISFKPGETAFATVTQTVRSSSGATLAQPHVFQFTAATAPSNGGFSGGSNPTVSANPYGVAAGDIDGDGDQDLLTANLNSNTVSVRLNNGSGTFNGTQEVSVGRGPSQVVLGDVDADGDLDLITANSRTIFPGTLSVRLNNGSGSFSGSIEVPVGDTPHAVALGDVDGDGDLDLLAANYTTSSSTTSSTVSVRLNDGLGSFNIAAPDVSVGTRPLSIAVGDVDNDGDLDFVTANSNTSTASVRLNNGFGNFSGGTEVQVEFNPESIVFGDVDGDGDLDLAVANRVSSKASVCLNNGSGTFTSTQLLAVGAEPHGIAVGDIDGDGDLDLATANTGSNTVSVRLNLGNGNFQGTQEVSVGTGPFSLALADLDGNGTLDLLTANSSTNSASVRLSSVAATAQVKVLAAAPARLSEQVSLYPNPAHASVHVQLPIELTQQHYQVQILNSLGQVVLQQPLSTQQELEVQVDSLPVGVYNLRIIIKQGLITKRLVIN
ncbi:FG-GAP-like repeat-containing protein [Hymenobacter sp. GOD-10R]|uniref:FG-GAP-like repeat-containing protein n=1 Tax=Hymenobacter sp. GOD-10R TaxID=3093922 RepID=UPI002D791EE1|nr:FG-GAP-like repeat-containing protein [Hymenobacter sp. GOD-10R]WRQ31120.1 FG-GAP-like repeat-containing protein [Hymenobacter sp. GOD-10R]